MFAFIDMIIVRPITNILFLIYGLVGDFGVAIILFTVLVKILMWPIIKRQLHQTRLMRKIQPQLAEIKKNCNGNRQMESIQMLDLYKRNNIKPFRSVLTLIIQLPIFVALYTAVRVMVLPTPTDNLSIRAYAPVAQMERIDDVIQKQEIYLGQPADAENKQSYDFHPKLFGVVDLDTKAGFGSISASIIMVFALASAFSQYWISRQQLPTNKKNRKTFRQIMAEAADGKEPDQTELNQIVSGQMSYMMPLMMLLLMINLPGALVFYYLISNLMTGTFLAKGKTKWKHLLIARSSATSKRSKKVKSLTNPKVIAGSKVRMLLKVKMARRVLTSRVFLSKVAKAIRRKGVKYEQR